MISRRGIALRESHAIDLQHITVSFKYWQLHSTGRRRYSSYRRFLSRTADRYLPSVRAEAAAAILPRMRSFIRALESRSFLCECSRCRSDFMNVGRLPNRRANMTCTILCSRLPAGPISRFSARSTAYFVCPLIFVNLYVRFPLAVGKMLCLRAQAAKYDGLARARAAAGSKLASFRLRFWFVCLAIFTYNY